MKVHLYNFYASVNLSADTYCPSCSNRLHKLSDGLFGTAWICEKCHLIYQLHLIKVPKKRINKEFMEYALNELSIKEEKK